MEPAVNKSTTEKDQKSFCKQPISCPWSTIQPYPSTSEKEEPAATTEKSSDKSCPSIQQSSSQFFYFLRLMQLFPETHPATLHTVLCLCNNNFFYAVDKLLYARKCKSLYNQSQRSYRRCPYEKNQPHCSHDDNCRSRRNKVLDLKVPQSGSTGARTTASGRSSKTDSGSLDDSFKVPLSNSSSSSSCSTSQSFDRRSTPSTSSASETLEDNQQASTSKASSSSEESIDNYSFRNQTIIQGSDIIII